MMLMLLSWVVQIQTGRDIDWKWELEIGSWRLEIGATDVELDFVSPYLSRVSA